MFRAGHLTEAGCSKSVGGGAVPTVDLKQEELLERVARLVEYG